MDEYIHIIFFSIEMGLLALFALGLIFWRRNKGVIMKAYYMWRDKNARMKMARKIEKADKKRRRAYEKLAKEMEP